MITVACKVLRATTSAAVVALVLLTATSPLSAKEQWARHHPVQGGLALLNLGDQEYEPQVFYGGKRAMVYRASDGNWVGAVGIPLSTDPGSALLEVDGKLAAFRIAPGEYGESHIEITDRRFVEPPDAELHQRIVREQQRLNEVRSIWRRSPAPQKMLLPAKGQLSTPYGYRRYVNGRLSSTHRGLDIAAPIGTPVVSPAAGRITLAQNLFYTGLTVVIDHGLGLHTLYAHLSEITAKEGDFVQAGVLIGKIGATGRSTGPHLHWGLTLNGTSIDPALLLSEGEIASLKQAPQPPAEDSPTPGQ